MKREEKVALINMINEGTLKDKLVWTKANQPNSEHQGQFATHTNNPALNFYLYYKAVKINGRNREQLMLDVHTLEDVFCFRIEGSRRLVGQQETTVEEVEEKSPTSLHGVLSILYQTILSKEAAVSTTTTKLDDDLRLVNTLWAATMRGTLKWEEVSNPESEHYPGMLVRKVFVDDIQTGIVIYLHRELDKSQYVSQDGLPLPYIPVNLPERMAPWSRLKLEVCLSQMVNGELIVGVPMRVVIGHNSPEDFKKQLQKEIAPQKIKVLDDLFTPMEFLYREALGSMVEGRKAAQKDVEKELKNLSL